MNKTLPVFGPENQNQTGPTVFGPGRSGASVAAVWMPPEPTKDAPVFGPPEGTSAAAAVFGPSPFDGLAHVFVPMFVRQDGPATVTGATHEVPKRQGQREIDRIIRKFLKRINADDIRIRRVGHTTYSWKHPVDPEPSDTGSDVRWEIKLAGAQMHMGVYDIKPFYRVVSGPFEVEKLVEVRKNILSEMDTDAGEG